MVLMKQFYLQFLFVDGSEPFVEWTWSQTLQIGVYFQTHRHYEGSLSFQLRIFPNSQIGQLMALRFNSYRFLNFKPLSCPPTLDIPISSLFLGRQNKSLKNRLVFQHAIFKKGNQDQFFLIQRTKHKKQKQFMMKELENNDILKQVSQNNTLTPSQKNILQTLISFKLIALEKQRILKHKLNDFIEMLKSNRSKNTKSNLSVLDEQIKLEMDSNKKFSKSIDIFLTETLNQRTTEQKQKIQQGHFVSNPQQQQFFNEGKERQKNQNGQVSQFEKSPAFQYANGTENNSQGMLPCNSFLAYQQLYSIPSKQITIRDSISQRFQTQKCEYLNTKSSQQKLNNMFMQKNASQNPNKEFMGTMGHSNMQISFFNFQREPSMIFMPLPVYNRSVMSEFFDRPNQQVNTDFCSNQKQEEKQKAAGLKSKSEEFETTGTGVKINEQNGENVSGEKEDSQISFMNEQCAK